MELFKEAQKKNKKPTNKKKAANAKNNFEAEKYKILDCLARKCKSSQAITDTR